MTLLAVTMVVNIVVPNVSGYVSQVIDIRLKYQSWKALRFNVVQQNIIARLKILRAVLLTRHLFSNVPPFRLVGRYGHFE